MATRYSVEGRVGIILLDNPPVNGLGHATRHGIVTHLRQALASADIDAVVLTGTGGFFSAGADIREFGTPDAVAETTLSDVIDEFEAADKPVIAAIDGTCLGGGLELALGAHYRVATRSSTLGLPEVLLGLVPGAGGTQRLPRAVGAGLAAQMITSGQTRPASALGDIPGQRLLDKVVDDNAVAAAIELAHDVAGLRPLPRLCEHAIDSDGAFALDAIRAQVVGRHRDLKAPLAALDLIEQTATATFPEGLTAERETFLELEAGEQSTALRHAFFAERAARKVPGVAPNTRIRNVEKIAVIGAGTMGGGIAMNFLNAGIPVTILETTQGQIDRGLSIIRGNYQNQVDKGKLSAYEFKHRMRVLTSTLDYADLADADLIIEAVFEDLEIKKQVFSRLDEVAKSGAILASNTSTLDLDLIAGFTRRPGDVIGMHFFSPANVMKLLEVVRGKETDDDVLATAMALGQRIGKTAVVSGVCDGFIGNRMLRPYQDAAMTMLYSGATPDQIDCAIERFGFAMGPFRMSDLAGNDTGWRIRQRHYTENPDMQHDTISDTLCEMGRYGQKTGSGWYDYRQGSREAFPSPTVAKLLKDYHAEQRTQRQSYTDEEIVERLIFALIDEGARILDEGIALRTSDIDVVYLSGYGFPRHRGGPMFYADTVGLDHVISSLRRYHADDWQPAPLLVRLAEGIESFTPNEP